MTEELVAGKTIVVLNKDLFFGVRLRQIGAELGYRVELVPRTELFLEKLHHESTALGIIDISIGPDWDLIAADRSTQSSPAVIAFGPHKEVEALRAAKDAGVNRVVSNGTFHRDPVTIIQRYATGAVAEIEQEEDEADLEA